MTVQLIRIALVVALAGSVLSCQRPDAGSTAGDVATPPPVTKAFTAVNDPHLHNAYVVTSKVVSGAQPDDDAAFGALSKLGIKTIISVDGARPNTQAAGKHGMRYVHIPIGYDGVSSADGRAIAKAISELPGPIYVHCHHGKHRSAAAVAVACVYNGQLQPAQAESVLQTFGTGANYKGLWQSARDARPLDPQELSALQVEYVESKKIGQMAEAMVAIDKYMDHLKLSQKAGWQVPADHADLDPPHEALQLQEHLHEIGRMELTLAKPADFQAMMRQAEMASKSLQEALSERPPRSEQADAAFKLVAASCIDCHKTYRD
ncbi:MAG: cytochrome c [Burkholderiales bacterium]|nr:cytochrome c [Phycisphaerae bacterium]